MSNNHDVWLFYRIERYSWTLDCCFFGNSGGRVVYKETVLRKRRSMWYGYLSVFYVRV